MSVHIFGVRHHGPGCARALRAALDELRPDLLLVEGPPDADDALAFVPRGEMKPPVALLLYVPDQPHRAVFYPFTTFSPEWQALQYAAAHAVPARFMDLPQAIQLAREPREARDTEGGSPTDEDVAPQSDADPRTSAKLANPKHLRDTSVSSVSSMLNSLSSSSASSAVQHDPIAMLAEAAGYADHELWWEQQIEQRRDATGLFEAIFEAMSALRADLTPKDEEEAQREAHMRQAIRAAIRDGFGRIAVVCGAWHAPALAPATTATEAAPSPTPDSPFPPREVGQAVRSGGQGVRSAAQAVKADATLLSGLKKVKVEATWIPWTNSRLSYRSGYGAGITSPGWYAHLWAAPDRVTIHWAARAAQLLRDEGLDASSASVIETVRLAEALAAMRDLPMPGIAELHEAIQTVLCHGETVPMRLIRDKLEIGEAMGAVPPETPAVPLQRDLEAAARRLNLHLSPESKNLDLDLRNVKNQLDRDRSQLLHRLRLLGVGWGKPQHVYGAKAGDFHENWQLKWEPEFAVALIEANVWGNTVESAAAAKARDTAAHAETLPPLTELLDAVMLAGLDGAVEYLLGCIATRAAVSADVRHLMDALPPLARIARYGDVRGTRAERVVPVIDGLFARTLVGLPGACASLDDEAAAAMVGSIENVRGTVGLLNRDDQRAGWGDVLRRLVAHDGVHGLVRGRCARLLLEMRALDGGELRRLAGLALSPAVPAPQAAAWVEGVLRGGGLELLQQDGLWLALDAWLADLAPDTFVALLPLLRRAFSGFHPPERRAMGEKVKRLRSAAGATASTSTGQPGAAIPTLNTARAGTVLPVLAHILGVSTDDSN
ncbi:MAG TPA: DUF5682 family protein [Ktedonobacterales bacterium]|nr:DUF5682 family protein [Ktedonobacterales bacterium]